ncbi:uncharacterized protein LOC141494411 [Macrotis lagotis]|uniref:uncharacterized protein LOC141494411 n=1 Tax=Macrotis lagotis TaxID=92651 RepID=UPI003D693F00
MNIDDYENVSLGKSSPWPLGQFLRIEPQTTHRTPKMARVALVLLTLALLASLTAIILLYFQVETCTNCEKAQWKTCLDNITTMTSEIQMLRSLLENTRTQTLETEKTRNGLEDVTVPSVVLEKLKGHLETMTLFPVSIHQWQTRNSAEEDLHGGGRTVWEEGNLHFGRVTEPPGSPFKEAQESGGVTETSGVHVKMLPATAEVQTDVKMLKDLLETINASYIAVRDEYRTILTLSSKGWQFHRGNLYYFSPKKTSWHEAEKFCVSLGSHLTSVTSVEEQEFLFKRTRGVPHWIGLTNSDTEDNWQWVDGTPYDKAISRRFWIRGHPQSWKMGDKCVEMRVKTLRSWNDRDCQGLLQGICKKVLKRFEEDLDVAQGAGFESDASGPSSERGE